MRSRHFIIPLLLLLTLAVYWRVGNNDFVYYDDPRYVTENPHVRTGLTLGNIRWAFTSLEASNWHPLTWLSHMTDCQLFGLNARGHHFTSVFLHLLNILLLFLLLVRMTGAVWRNAFAAALFALHPVHVESVAWIAERKDVLSTLFFLLTLLCYGYYTQRPSLKRYLPVTLAFALGLMAKPMLVTLPFVLLLLDYWPLGRFPIAGGPASGSAENPPDGIVRQRFGLLVLEKTPLFLMAFASCMVTYYAQSKGATVATVQNVPLSFRAVNALVAYTAYLRKMIWPADLAVLYPLPPQIPLMDGVWAGLLLGAVTFLVLLRGKRFPFLPVGWLWFIGTLVPVIGLVQVGVQSMADRYTYIPSIGLYIMIAWGAGTLARNWQRRRLLLGAAAVAVMIVFSVLTWRQIGYWHTSTELFSHAIEVTENNFVAQSNLGYALEKEGRLEAAIDHYAEAARIDPDGLDTQMNLGAALVKAGRLQEAIVPFSAAVRIDPQNADARYFLAMALGQSDHLRDSEQQLREAIRINPAFVEAYYNLGVSLARQGKMDAAAVQFAEAVRLRPDFEEAMANLEKARMQQKPR